MPPGRLKHTHLHAGRDELDLRHVVRHRDGVRRGARVVYYLGMISSSLCDSV
jgi:hypothetical protein